MATEPTLAPRILIVDDHPDNIEVLKVRLEALGYRTICASDGEQALRMVVEDKPDLILLDVMMPRMDGNEVARRIKGDPTLPFIPIIMQTALDSTQSKVEGLGAGADGYVTKPIDYAELQARVEAMLRIKALQDKLALQNEQLEQLAITDGLTGVFNRRHLDERLDEMWEHSMRLGEDLSVVMFDLDHFKRVNDTHGHQAGDRVLREFAKIITEDARDIDRIGRYGGEEFMVLLPGTPPAAAVTFAERVRQHVAKHRFEFEGGSLTCSVSSGVAGWTKNHPTVNSRITLVKAADDSLYLAKAAGRDRVMEYESPAYNERVKDLNDQHEDRASAGGAAHSTG